MLNQLGNVLVAKLDAQDSQAIKAVIDSGIARFGYIYGMMKNAGYR
ncbi:hypothetical protein [Dyadobacter sp. 3J3]|nr:hypothetical protein [Dyadobacter sp. 3J3]